MKGEDITRLFSLELINHYELLTLFDLEFQTSWRLSSTEIAFPARRDHLLVVRWDDEIKSITRTKSLKQEVWR